jgi:ribosomal protein L37AE/L43A
MTTPSQGCPFCGAPIAPGSAVSPVCEYCRSPRSPEPAPEEGEEAAFPHFRNRPVPCPGCGKKVLSPRVGTKDFRCQACSATFPGPEIESRSQLATTREGATAVAQGVMRNIVRRHIPKAFAGPRKVQTDSSSAGACLGSIVIMAAGIAAGYVTYGALSSWGFGGRLAVTITAGVLVAVVVLLVVGGLSNHIEERKLQAEPQWQWERQNPHLVALRGRFGGLLAIERMEAMDAVPRMGASREQAPELQAAEDGAKLDGESIMPEIAAGLLGSDLGARMDEIVAALGTEEEKALFAHVRRVFPAGGLERSGDGG